MLKIIGLLFCLSQALSANVIENMLDSIHASKTSNDLTNHEYSPLSYISNNRIDEEECSSFNGLRAGEIKYIEDFMLAFPDRKDVKSCLSALKIIEQENFWMMDRGSKKSLQELYLTDKLPKLTSIPLDQVPLIDEAFPIDSTKSPVLFHADLPKGVVALTFDDGPIPSKTNKILNALEKEGIKATFFAIGRLVKQFPEVAIRAHTDGHTYSSHTMTHPNLAKISFKKAIDEIQEAKTLVGNTIQKESSFFRFPYGAWNKKLKSYVKENQISTFFWNIDTLDWKIKDPVALYERSIRLINKSQRGIILFHDIHSQTTELVPVLLKELKRANYQVVVFVE
ncbi:MAG: polysaccharide deacetylase family protein [Bdellovibrionales bacterium]